MSRGSRILTQSEASLTSAESELSVASRSSTSEIFEQLLAIVLVIFLVISLDVSTPLFGVIIFKQISVVLVDFALILVFVFSSRN